MATSEVQQDSFSGVQQSSGTASGSKSNNNDRKMLDLTRDKPIKISVKIMVPVKDHPKFNFVGKLLGPKGNTLKRLQEETLCKMAVLGKGSMRDRKKEEEFRNSGESKYFHLREDLHVEVYAHAPAAEAHARLAYALALLARYLVPDYNDDIRHEQMLEMQLLQASGATINSNPEISTLNAVDNVALGSQAPDLLLNHNPGFVHQPKIMTDADIKHQSWLTQTRRRVRTANNVLPNKRNHIFETLSKARAAAARNKYQMYSAIFGDNCSDVVSRINFNII